MRKKGWVDIRESYIGITANNKNGKEMSIIGYPPIGERDRRDLFVRFTESGNIVTTRYEYFIKGKVIDRDSVETLPCEEWRDVVGYEGRYMVSNLGRVKNYPNRTRRDARIITPHIIRSYYSVCLRDSFGNSKQHRVHRLVAKAFIPNPYNLPQVNHKDENKLNNRLDNLEWCDAEYNTNYGTARERQAETFRKNKRGLEKPHLHKPVEMISLSGDVLRRFPSIKDAAKETGYSHGSISSACKRYEEGRPMRKRICHFKWRYAK